MPQQAHGQPSCFLDTDDHLTQLRRFLTTEDGGLPLDVRVAGAMVLLHGAPVWQIQQLTADHLTRTGTGRYLTLDSQPILLPPRLADLLDQLAARPRTVCATPTAPHHPGYLFPGRPASRPIGRAVLVGRLNRHGLHVRPARNTALIGRAGDLPAAVLADLFGLHINTAIRWTRYAHRDWAAYLAARSGT